MCRNKFVICEANIENCGTVHCPMFSYRGQHFCFVGNYLQAWASPNIDLYQEAALRELRSGELVPQRTQCYSGRSSLMEKYVVKSDPGEDPFWGILIGARLEQRVSVLRGSSAVTLTLPSMSDLTRNADSTVGSL